jgi:ferredoxin-fold anticodon binding domain-containing protein
LKQECGLFFQWGVILKDGARMVDCNIQKFYDGAEIENGGEIQDSEFSLNWRGVQIANFAANTVSKISNR